MAALSLSRHSPGDTWSQRWPSGAFLPSVSRCDRMAVPVDTLPVVPVPIAQGWWEWAQHDLTRHGHRELAWLSQVIDAGSRPHPRGHYHWETPEVVPGLTHRRVVGHAQAFGLIAGSARRARGLPAWPLPASAIFFAVGHAAQEPSQQRPSQSAAGLASAVGLAPGRAALQRRRLHAACRRAVVRYLCLPYS